MKAARILGLLLGCALAAQVAAQSWPAKPVTIVIGFPPGAGTDQLTRYLADQLREKTGQPFVTENKPGFGGLIAAQQVARAAPDGYTVLFTGNAFATAPHLFKNPGFDPIKNFTPVSTFSSQGFVLVVNPQGVPVNSVAELTVFLKARPGQISYASGNNSVRIAAEMYRQMAGFEALNVPYKGVPQALADLLGGRVHFMFTGAAFAMGQIKAGKIRALAVTNPQRISAAPELPTMAEAGLPGYELYGWFALFLPANAPREVARRLAEMSNAVVTSEKGREFLRSTGGEPFPGSPESLAKFVESEMAKWGRIVKAAGIQPE